MVGVLGMMLCLHEQNPFGGFGAQHMARCSRLRGGGVCLLPVSHHVTLGVTPERRRGFYCANTCATCAEALGKRKDAVVVNETFIGEKVVA